MDFNQLITGVSYRNVRTGVVYTVDEIGKDYLICRSSSEALNGKPDNPRRKDLDCPMFRYNLSGWVPV